MRTKNYFGIAAVLLGYVVPASLTALAGEPLSSDPPFTRLLTDGIDTAAVRVQKSSGKIEVQLSPGTKLAPRSIMFLMKQEGASPVILDLRVLAPDPVYLGSLPASQVGQLEQSEQSFVGLEISIPWSFGGTSTLGSSNPPLGSSPAEWRPFSR